MILQRPGEIDNPAHHKDDLLGYRLGVAHGLQRAARAIERELRLLEAERRRRFVRRVVDVHQEATP